MSVSSRYRRLRYRPMWRASSCMLWLALASSTGCGGKGEIGEAAPHEGTGGGSGTDGGDGAAGVPVRDSGVATKEAEAGPLEPGADAARDVDAPLATCPTSEPPGSSNRRLTRGQYNNTISDLLGDSSNPADDVLEDDPNYEGDGETFAVTSKAVSGYHALAHQLALKVTAAAALPALLGCDPAQAGEANCRHSFIEGFVGRAFRRPATTDDLADFEGVFATGQQLEGTFGSGARAVVEVALQSPEFLYRIEFGEPGLNLKPGWERPAPYEMASRLSYLLWGTMPDLELRNAAAQGKLGAPQEIEAQARRLLASDRSHEVVRNFYFRRLGITPGQFNTPAQFPKFTQEIAALAQKETAYYLDDVVWHGPGDFATVLTSPTTWLNDRLAIYYGVGAVTGDMFRKVNVDPAQRAGILTQASFLSASSFSNENPVKRGYQVASEFLCMNIPPEPPDVVASVMPPTSEPKTTRERYAQHSSQPECRSCHQNVDPLGFAFEHYDAVGQWRDTENGFAIDASGAIYETDAQGKFDGAVELVALLARSQTAKDCFADKWASYAYPENPASLACTREALRKAFSQGNFSVRELLVGLTQTDNFLYRSTEQP